VLFVPLVLIPQLIFGGALIKYDEMNHDLDLKYVFQKWFATQTEHTPEREDAKLRIPFISYFVATHYSYEALVVAQDKLNPLTGRQEEIQAQLAVLAANKHRTEVEDNRFDDLKETLALLSGLDAASVHEVEKRLRRVDQVISGKPLDTGALHSKMTGYTAERLYTNQKVKDLVSKAETEQDDYRRSIPVNVFFAPEKRFVIQPPSFMVRLHWLNPHVASISVYTYNTMVLVLSSVALLGVLYGILRRQLRPNVT
jgi:hypothetical protein